MRRNYEKYIIIGLFIFIPLSIYLRDVIGINVNKYIILFILCTPILFFLSTKSNIILLSYLIPFFSGIPSNYIFVVIILSILIKTEVKVSNSLYLCIIGILSIELLNNLNYNFKVFEFLMYGIYLFSIIKILSLGDNNISNTKNIYAFSIGLLMCNIIIFLNTLTVFDIDTLITNGYRYGNVLDLKATESMILTHDQNFIGYMCILSISSIAICINNIRMKKTKKTLLLLLNILNSYFALLAASRAFIICLICLFIWIIFKRFITGKIFSIFYMCSLILTLYIILMSLFPTVLESIIDRFYEQDITGGRTEINSYYIDFIKNNPIYLFFGTSILSMMEVAFYPSTIHNATLQIIVGYGVVGSLFFLASICILLKNEIKKFEIKMLRIKANDFIPFLLGLLMIQTIPFISPYYFMLPMIISIFALRIRIENYEEKRMEIS